MSDTPRTNEEVDDVSVNGVSSRDAIVPANFARGLDRELNRYKDAVEKFLALASDTCNCPGCRTAREVKASIDAPSSDNWRAMETAPRDGTKVLVWTKRNRVEIAWWDAKLFATHPHPWRIHGLNGARIIQSYPPVAWMPLPPPPTI